MIVYKYYDIRRPLLIYTVSTCEEEDKYVMSWNAEDEEIYFGINENIKGVQYATIDKDNFDKWVKLTFNIILEEGANKK